MKETKGENERRVDAHYEAILERYGHDPVAEYQIWSQWQADWQYARIKDQEEDAKRKKGK
jgi:hypothetical protein